MSAARRWSGAVIPALIATVLVATTAGCAASGPPASDPRVNYLNAVCPSEEALAAATRALTRAENLADIQATSAAARDALLESERRLGAIRWPTPLMADVALLRAGELDDADWFDQSATANSLGVVAFHWNPSPNGVARIADERIRRWVGLPLGAGCGAP